MVWGFFKSTDDPELRLMLRIKGNIAKDSGGLQYKAEERQVDIAGKAEGVPVVHWMGKPAVRSDDALADNSDPENGKIGRAKRWLVEFSTSKGGRVLSGKALARDMTSGISGQHGSERESKLTIPEGLAHGIGRYPHQMQTRCGTPLLPLLLVHC